MAATRDVTLRIGLISDTHGLLRDAAIAALRDVDHILHAGDIGRPEVLQQLGELAPVTAVRGNNDEGGWARDIPEVERMRFGEVTLCLLHEVARFTRLGVTDAQVVVTGHSHRPAIERRDGVLFVNPGSAGPRRFRLPVTVGELIVDGAGVEARIVELAI